MYVHRIVFLALTAVLSSMSLAQANKQPTKVLVLDDLGGKPEPRAKVEYFCTGKTNDLPQKAELTDDKGVAEIPYYCQGDLQLELTVVPAGKKEMCGGPLVLGDADLSSGIVSDPTADGGIRCPKKASKKLKATPNVIVVFVKKPTWWQSHIAG